jgi:hypothetical protein
MARDVLCFRAQHCLHRGVPREEMSEMRFRLVMIAMVASGLACEKGPSPSNGAKGATSSAALAPSHAGAAPAQGQTALDDDRVVEKHALSPATGSVTSASATAGSAPRADDGNGEPMDDVDDGVPATDKSGVDNAVEDDDSDGTDIQVEE